MKTKHIYWFAYYNINCPSVRYRGKYVLDFLAENSGITFSIVYPGYSREIILHFIKIYFSAFFFRKKNSAIVFQKIYTTGIYATALKALLLFRKKNTMYDFDDAEYIRFPPKTIRFFLRNCEKVSAGSKVLVEYARHYNLNVMLLTSPVIDHGIIKTGRNEIFTVGWIGFYNTPHESSKPFAHKRVLNELIFPAIKKMDFNLRLVMLGVENDHDRNEIRNYFSCNKNILVDLPDQINWLDEKSVYERVRQFDIGFAPLLNCELHRAKSAFRLKQYFSCGVPALANNVGENSAFLKHEVNGYLCNSTPEFRERLVKVRNLSEKDYSRLCSNAQKTFSEFSMENYCSMILEYLSSKGELVFKLTTANHELKMNAGREVPKFKDVAELIKGSDLKVT
ncbi:MAG TPA: hypothetical protein VE978_20760 [Chitinophagales bacterium]|nr:hypothetical protein [Chitinophagales bacterium]